MIVSWSMLIALGAFHGINPGMGWLFAVALGMQERRRGAVLRALLPLGAGHALAVAGAVGVALAVGSVIPLGWLRWPIAGVLVSSVNTGAYTFDHMPIDLIERIEIVRGPRAAIWCADALGGVIKIFTRHDAGLAATARVAS